MLHLTMFREQSQDETTISKLYNGLTFLCDILEDVVREVPGEPVESWKVHGKTAIPAGTYRLGLADSQRFGPDTLTVLDVDGFEYIRIHAGNTAKDTEGCLLPGVRVNGYTVGNSKVTLQFLRHIIVPELQAGEEVTLQIIPYDAA